MRTAPGDHKRAAVTADEFGRVLAALEAARPFGKAVHRPKVLGLALKLLDEEGGASLLYSSAARCADAGLFDNSDWASPGSLQPALARGTLLGGGLAPALECLSELHILAIARGDAPELEELGAAQARAHLEEILARNLDLLFASASEESRLRGNTLPGYVIRLFEFLLAKLGAGDILRIVTDEIERVLLQRPIMAQRVERLLHSARRALDQLPAPEAAAGNIGHFIAALYGPSPAARDLSADKYEALLPTLDATQLGAEAEAFGQAMDSTGLVCPQHAVLLRYIAERAPEHLPAALALDEVGRVSQERHAKLISEIIDFAIRPQTARCIYGLSRLLNHGTLFFPRVEPGLQRLMVLPLHPEVEALLQEANEWPQPPPPRVLLLAGTLSVLGQPRGVDQGHNPTCQAARAISLWAQNDVGYLLELIASGARDHALVMHFEGEAIDSAGLPAGLAAELHTELDPVSLVLTPHLDRIYMEMSRRTLDRPGDGHRWVNPEFHGWWVHRGFADLVVEEGEPTTCEEFIRLFYADYHPQYNGGRHLVYAQPCGVVVTDHSGTFVGWHAVSIQRVERDPESHWRVYFFNPNRDKGQNWGQGVVTSTHDHGEYEGESSLPFAQFVSRLYVFHYKTIELGDAAAVPDGTVAEIRAAIAASWAAGQDWLDQQ